MPIPGSNDGRLISDTKQTLVAAPASGLRVVGWASVFNDDTAQVTLTVYLRNTNVDPNDDRPLYRVDLGVDETWELPFVFTLHTYQTLMANLTGPIATRQPAFCASFEDWT